MAVTPSATPLLTREAIFKMKEAGVVRLGISLDGSCPEIHDKFRGLPLAWARTIQAVEWAGEPDCPSRSTPPSANLCNLFEKLAIVMWNVFFLVPVGRGQLADLLSGDEFEQVFGKIYELFHRVSFQIKTTEAMHYRRYPLQNNLQERKMGHGHPTAAVAEYEPGAPPPTPRHGPTAGPPEASTTARASCSSPTSATSTPSDSCPSTPPTSAKHRLAEIYRNAPIFKALRGTSQLEGKCGACEYKEICGGSRARAYALTGDPLAQEPCCIYPPRNWRPRAEGEPTAVCQPEVPRSLVILQ